MGVGLGTWARTEAVYDARRMSTGEVLDGYIRVSVVGGRAGDRFQSPEAQREAIAGWAKVHGVTIGQWHEDLDQSGGTMDRPGMNRVRERVARGETGGIVVARLDRFARTLIGGLVTIRELHEQGARVVSVAESIDPATPMGRAMLGLLLLMGEWQRDQADEHLAAAQSRAASAGRFPGRPPYGYLRDADGHTVVHPEQADVVRRIYRERAAGTGWRSIADQLTRADVPTSTGLRNWAASTLVGIVRSESYLGTFIGPRGLRVEGAWDPLVTREQWEAANEIHGVRDSSRAHHDRLLAGVARCANCRRTLKRAKNPEGFISYACNGIGCQARASVGATILDEHVLDLMDQRVLRLALNASAADDTTDHERLVAAADAASRELEAWRDDLEIRVALGDQDWREGMLARARARDDAVMELAQHRAEANLVDAGQLVTGRRVTVRELPWDVRRQVAEAMLHSVWVRPSTVRGVGARRHVASRLLVVWADDPARPVLPGVSAGQLGPVHW